MGPIGHCAIAVAAKPLAPRMPVWVLLIATLLLDILAIVFMFVGIEGGERVGNPWSHGLLMSLIWSIFAAFLAGTVYHSYRSGAVVGIAVFSHWILDFVFAPDPISELFVAFLAMGQRTCSAARSAASFRELAPGGSGSVQLHQCRHCDRTGGWHVRFRDRGVCHASRS